MSDNKPAKSFRIGFVTATIWENDGPNRAFYSIEVTRMFKEDDRIRSSHSLNHADILNAMKVLERAEAWISEQLS